MNRFRLSMCIFVLILFYGSAVLCATFDERLWEKYAVIETSSLKNTGGLAGVYLGPHQLGDVTAKTPFADIRVVTDRKEEVAYQIVARKPEQRDEEVPARMQNLSQTGNGETWLEVLIDRKDVRVNAVEIMTSDSDFSRQVQILGSNDGTSWNTLRKDGVVFDISRGEKLRHTRINFPHASYRRLALKIVNGTAQPLTINSVRVLQSRDVQGQSYSMYGTAGKPESNASQRESSIIVRMNSIFPLDRLTIGTTEHNFQRSVEVQIKRGNRDWERWAQGTIFNFNTPTMNESQLVITMPEVATGEFRLVFKNLDSPPISVTGITGEGYRKLLVFKPQPDQKLYLFWGNPLSQHPQYDLGGLIARQKLDEIPIVHLSQSHPNTKFAGTNARLPVTERYKFLLYGVVALAIAGLIFLQYRVFRRIGE